MSTPSAFSPKHIATVLALIALVVAVLLFTVLDANQSTPSAQSTPTKPIPATPSVPKHAIAVTTDHPLATNTALDILKQGGSSADALVVVQLILTLVEPQSSGIGGGAFALFWNDKEKHLSTYDGREKAPQTAQENYFFGADNKPLKWSFDTVRAAKSVGVPGTLKLLKDIHDKHGKLPWNDLLDKVIKIANEGYPLDHKVYRNLVFAQSKGLDATYKTAFDFYFNADGTPKKIGTIVTNPAFAQTLTTIKRDGIEAFYGGTIAQAITQAIYSAPKQAKQGQQIQIKDFRDYQVIERAPICSPYRQWKICGMGPPSSGALTVGQILSILSHFDMKTIGHTAQGIHLFAEASKLAYADRALYMADSDFVNMPTKGLLDQTYLKSRAALINPNHTTDKVRAGKPPRGMNIATQSPDTQGERPSTSHFNIADDSGNIISMTTTIEQGFGSGIMVGGFMLNNELTDFSFVSHRYGKPVANRVEGGKRPRSSMSPTIVFDEANRPVLAIGSPGGSRIISYVSAAIVAYLDWDMPLNKALNIGHFANRNTAITELEKNSDSEEFASELKEYGHKIKFIRMNSGLQAIALNADGSLSPVSDLRRQRR